MGSSGQDLIGDLVINSCIPSLDNDLKADSLRGTAGWNAGSP